MLVFLECPFSITSFLASIRGVVNLKKGFGLRLTALGSVLPGDRPLDFEQLERKN
jgi:hypothetical protein